jgi:hypothetical protein
LGVGVFVAKDVLLQGWAVLVSFMSNWVFVAKAVPLCGYNIGPKGLQIGFTNSIVSFISALGPIQLP